MIDSIANEGGAGKVDLKKARRKFSVADPLKIDRIPPHALEAEQGVLGCVLLSPNECMTEVVEKFKDATVFYDLRHQTLFEVLREMYDKRTPIDLITLQQRLKDGRRSATAPTNLLEDVGGLAYLASLPDAVPSAANLSYYIEIVREKFVLRRMINTCTAVVGRAYDHEGEVEALVDEVERNILAISQDQAAKESTPIKDLVHAAITKIEEYHQNQGALLGLSTGFADLDKLTTGLHGGEMIIIAGRPSMGKTALAVNIAENVALDQKIPVGVFSLEMTAESLVLRMLCSRSRVNLRNMREGFLAERDFPKLTGAAGKLAGAPLYIDDTSGLSILQLRAKARRMHQAHGIKLFVIDYLQLLNSTNRRAENRQQEIADISNGVKALAKELNVPIIILAQLNRELEKRGPGERPRLSDLRESGSLEQDADLVALLFKEKEEEDSKEPAETEAVPVKLFIAKQRNGPTGDVDLMFLKSYTRFESVSKVQSGEKGGDY